MNPDAKAWPGSLHGPRARVGATGSWTYIRIRRALGSAAWASRYRVTPWRRRIKCAMTYPKKMKWIGAFFFVSVSAAIGVACGNDNSTSPISDAGAGDGSGSSGGSSGAASSSGGSGGHGSSGSSSGTPPSSSSGGSSGGNRGADASSGGVSSSSSSGGGGAVDASARGPCAQLHCASPQICCAVRTGMGMAPNLSCSTLSACMAADAVTCFGGDCPSGQVCCGAPGSSQPLGSACMNSCAASGPMSRIVCQSVADCPSGDTCSGTSPTSSTGGVYKACHSGTADSGGGG
jgi:hypothetical protein